MGMAETNIREAVAREIAPLLADCLQINADLDRSEAALPILLDGHNAREAIRTRRAKLEAVITKLHGIEEHIINLAKERWPQWRT